MNEGIDISIDLLEREMLLLLYLLHTIILVLSVILFYGMNNGFMVCKVATSLSTSSFNASHYVLSPRQVSKLELVYKLRNLPDCEPIVKSEVCRLINDEQFHVLKDRVKSYGDINRELARFFGLGVRNCESGIRCVVMMD